MQTSVPSPPWECYVRLSKVQKPTAKESSYTKNIWMPIDDIKQKHCVPHSQQKRRLTNYAILSFVIQVANDVRRVNDQGGNPTNIFAFDHHQRKKTVVELRIYVLAQQRAMNLLRLHIHISMPAWFNTIYYPERMRVQGGIKWCSLYNNTHHHHHRHHTHIDSCMLCTDEMLYLIESAVTIAGCALISTQWEWSLNLSEHSRGCSFINIITNRVCVCLWVRECAYWRIPCVSESIFCRPYLCITSLLFTIRLV